MTNTKLVLCLLPILSLIACGGSGPGGQRIATYDGGEITSEEFFAYLQSGSRPKIKAETEIDEEQGLQELLRRYAANRILADEGGPEPEPDEPAFLYLSPESKVVIGYAKERLGKVSYEIGDEEARAFYEENRATRFTLPEQIKVQHILVRKDTHPGPAAEAEVQLILQELTNGASFDELVGRRSESGTVRNNGIIGPIFRGKMDETFENEVFAKKDSDRPFVVDTPIGLHVVQVLEYEPVRVVAFDDARPRIINALVGNRDREKYKQQMTELREKFGVSFDVDYSQAAEDQVVLKVSEKSLTRVELEAVLEQNRLIEPGLVETRIEGMIEENLIYLEALAQGLDSEERLVQRRRLWLMDRAANRARRQRVIKWAEGVPDEEITAFFEDNRRRFVKPKTFEASYVLVPFDDGAPFQRLLLAEESARVWRGEGSPDPEAVQAFCDKNDLIYKELGTLAAGEAGVLGPYFQKALVSLSSNQVAEPVKTEHGLLVVAAGQVEDSKAMELPGDANAIRERFIALQKKDFVKEIDDLVLEEYDFEIVSRNLLPATDDDAS